ncbi:hypothetical protein EYC84_006171 [Monilinia fructicola]|uniref:Uncharacterized protein n=1 Tax=Monilinia fructicola TaxID=38448 RepID=A0A5M9K2I4_MONFR|nr:hypothetical protein EYC84_006171 [Monilinia fructicola]
MIKSTTLVLLMITGVDEKVIANPSNSSTNVPLRRRTALRSSLMEVAGGLNLIPTEIFNKYYDRTEKMIAD